MSADFWAGYISGAAGIIIGNPLDLIKTRLQAGDASVHATSTESLRGTFDRAGTLVRGATAPILGYGALNGILFYTYNRSLTLLHQTPPADNPSSSPSSLTKIWTAGALGGFATFLISAPTELIKCRAQVSSSHHLHHQQSASPPLSSIGIAKEILHRDGLRGLYHGGTVTSLRDAVGYGFYFWSYEICNRILSPPPSKDSVEDESPRMAAAKVLVAGGVAGVVTWASIFPLDVVKTRVQTQSFASPAPSPAPAPAPAPAPPSSSSPSLPTTPLLRGNLSPTPNTTLTSPTSSTTTPPPAKPQTRPSALQTAKTLYKTEGIRPFFRGLGICSVRAFIVNAVQWAVYEWMIKVLRESST
ncbi:hypothetical protein FKW77_003558 [Venturia effusa]|uniref:Mitochondrial thiamine pyrophosphate carrier 1 n=1 Tax=Venturia effusa TaxID=50376 RepID=A0A517LR00_9PEZI|nr:hypothetical protein FKW77_003558 [Venturia effusa]